MSDSERGEGVGISPRKIYPWTMSATEGMGFGFEQSQLDLIAIGDLDYWAERCDGAPYGIIPSVLELILHGNDRRAADLARRVVALNPAHVDIFRGVMDENALKFWLEKPLEEIPSTPSEIRGPVEYIQ